MARFTRHQFSPLGGDARFWRGLALALVLLIFIWFGGLLQFVMTLPMSIERPNGTSDGIVVLTGGAERIDEGLSLLTAGQAKTLLITGVDPATTAEALQARNASAIAKFECCIELGHLARDTRGNAIETALWVERDGHRSLRLVTASYHMPRTLLLFRLAMPDTDLIAHPVFPMHVKLDAWWRYPGTARLLAVEYTKYLISLISVRLLGSPIEI